MWLASQHGFYSVVEKQPGQIHIRARCRNDLENLIALARLAAPPVETPEGDYRWRVVVGKPDLLRVLAAIGQTVNYPNFKNRIHALPDQRDKSTIYSRIWSLFADYQRRGGTSG
jgi:hypothetical protein